eukprot:TRINITY_DN38462_c0_g1_i1.p2 TRINITY_DN38462_c0_g1~~TRINITY_DN38462_c0_g1_i1.p2  ORF type:complete len:123 (-),score=21.23 TRINITY_DN38462_c0_g1_i1:25-393(-)
MLRWSLAACAAWSQEHSPETRPDSCFDRHWPRLQQQIAPLGRLALLPWQLFGREDLPGNLLAETYSSCFSHNHEVYIVALDLHSYAGNRQAEIADLQVTLLNKFLDYMERNVGENVWRALSS